MTSSLRPTSTDADILLGARDPCRCRALGPPPTRAPVATCPVPAHPRAPRATLPSQAAAARAGPPPRKGGGRVGVWGWGGGAICVRVPARLPFARACPRLPAQPRLACALILVTLTGLHIGVPRSLRGSVPRDLKGRACVPRGSQMHLCECIPCPRACAHAEGGAPVRVPACRGRACGPARACDKLAYRRAQKLAW